MLLNKEQIIAFLPHRDPFLFIDEVELIEGSSDDTLKDLVGKRVICHYYVNPAHPILEGHFPENPIWPGVIQVEMMGQASCFGVYHFFTGNPLQVKLLGVNNAKFRKPVIPGMKLRIEVLCTKSRSSILNYECRVFEGEQLISEAIILASVNI